MRLRIRKRNPTDLEILDAIFDRYYQTFSDYDQDSSIRSSKNYVPIDVYAIGEHLKVDGDMIFGRLNYHLEEKYGYGQADGGRVSFFAMMVGGDRHCIHFPYLGSVVAALRQEDQKFRIATTLATASLFLSAMALIISILL